MIESTNKPMTVNEMVKRLITVRVPTTSNKEQRLMATKMRKRDDIAEKKAKMAFEKEYGVEGSMRNGL